MSSQTPPQHTHRIPRSTHTPSETLEITHPPTHPPKKSTSQNKRPAQECPSRAGRPSIISLTMSYFHTGIRTIIGAESFHRPVRDGKGWDQLAMVIRLKPSPNPTSLQPCTALRMGSILAQSILLVQQHRATAPCPPRRAGPRQCPSYRNTPQTQQQIHGNLNCSIHQQPHNTLKQQPSSPNHEPARSTSFKAPHPLTTKVIGSSLTGH